MPKDQREIYINMEIDLLENISSRLKMVDQGDLADIPYTLKWQQEKLLELRQLKLSSLEIVKSYESEPLDNMYRDIDQVVSNSLDSVDPIYNSAIDNGKLKVAPLPRNTSGIQRIASVYFESSENQYNLIRTSMLNSSQQIYLDTINQTTLEVLTGINTPQVALSKTIRKWAESGMPLIQNKAGNIYSAEGYVNTIFRTMVRNATSDVQFERMNEYQVDLMEVSSHANARPLCARDQGRIYSRSGESNKYKSLSQTSYGMPNGLFGINCRHDFYPYFEGNKKTFTPYKLKETDRNYELAQNQRRLERNLRDAKRQKVIYKANDDVDNYKKALERQKNATSSLKSFTEKNSLTRNKDRESIFNIY